MELLGVLTLWLHVTAAAIWVGGNFMIAMVIVPYFKRSLPPCGANQNHDPDWQEF